MSPTRSGQPGWLALHNSQSSPHTFTFDVVGTQYGGTLHIQPDEVVNVFTANLNQKYTVIVAVDGEQESEYEWEVEDGRESLVAEWSGNGLEFKELRLL